MSPSERSFLFYLEDIRQSIEKIMVCCENASRIEALEEDWIKYDAILRNLEIIGEAAKNIPDEIKDSFSEIPWNDMYRTRNIISHQYFGIDSEIIWRIITIHLPSNLEQIKKL